MKILKNKKIVSFLVVALLMLSFATNVFAGSSIYTNKKVYGGAAQTLAMHSRQQAYPCLYVSSLNWRGQTGWKYRDYTYSGIACSSTVYVSGSGNFIGSYYANAESTVKAKTWISSTNSSDYLYFSGNLTS